MLNLAMDQDAEYDCILDGTLSSLFNSNTRRDCGYDSMSSSWSSVTMFTSDFCEDSFSTINSGWHSSGLQSHDGNRMGSAFACGHHPHDSLPQIPRRRPIECNSSDSTPVMPRRSSLCSLYTSNSSLATSMELSIEESIEGEREKDEDNIKPASTNTATANDEFSLPLNDRRSSIAKALRSRVASDLPPAFRATIAAKRYTMPRAIPKPCSKRASEIAESLKPKTGLPSALAMAASSKPLALRRRKCIHKLPAIDPESNHSEGTPSTCPSTSPEDEGTKNVSCPPNTLASPLKPSNSKTKKKKTKTRSSSKSSKKDGSSNSSSGISRASSRFENMPKETKQVKLKVEPIQRPLARPSISKNIPSKYLPRSQQKILRKQRSAMNIRRSRIAEALTIILEDGEEELTSSKKQTVGSSPKFE